MSLSKQPEQVLGQSSDTIEKDEPRKKPYQRPVLNHFGSLWELTAGGGGTDCDGANFSAPACCHCGCAAC